VVDVLGQLTAIAEQMFNKLRDKAETQKRVIDSITARINAASAKATQLKKTTKATVVVSPSSYPFSQPTHYQNLFTPILSKPDLCKLQSTKPKLGPILRPSNQEVDLSFSVMEQYPRKSKKVSPPVASSVDELVLFGQEKPKVKKSKKPKRKEDIDPLVWDEIMSSSVCRESQYRYQPGFQNFPENSHLPDHLMPSNVATNITFEKISKETIAPTLLWDLPPVGIDSDTPSVTPVPPATPQTPIPADQTRRIKKEDTETRPTVPLPPSPTQQTDIEVRPTIPPPPPIHRVEPEIRPPIPPPLPVQKENTEVIPLPPVPSGIIGPGVSNIPPPPPPPPVVRRTVPVPPAVPRPTRNTRIEPQEDLHTQLYARILERRSAMEDEPPAIKKDNNDDEWE
jgi:hypothetical protein